MSTQYAGVLGVLLRAIGVASSDEALARTLPTYVAGILRIVAVHIAIPGQHSALDGNLFGRLTVWLIELVDD